VDGGQENRYYNDSTVAIRLTDLAIDFMEEHQEQPFFLYLSHWETHNPQVYPQERVAYYEDKLGNYPEGEFDQVTPEYAAGVEQLDNSVDRVMQKLKELELEENTIVIFTSDNGGTNMSGNNPLRGKKGTFYEGGIRTPFCIKWPGVINPGSETDIPVIGIDLMPTFAQIASVHLPESQPVDGESLLPILKGEDAINLKERPIYFHFPLYLGGAPIVPAYNSENGYWRAVPSSTIIQGDWKLIHYYEYDSTELFNLKTDVSEQHNLASKRPNIKEDLMNDLQSWIEEVDAPVPEIENESFIDKE
jgi:arylsulfatase A-like enzyme